MRARTVRGRWWAAVLAGCLLLAGCGGPPPRPTELPGPPAAPADPAGHPNIVFVLTDDLDAGLLRFMPEVRRMQAEGASFTHYAVADTLCCPSRSSIFTGRYPHNTGVYTNTPPDGGYRVFRNRGNERDTFATTLQRAGYRTAMMGKYLNDYRPEADGVPPGWNEWDVSNDGYREYDYTLNVNGQVRRHGHAPADYLTDVLAGRAQAFVRRHARAREPFALEVATFAPHGPYTPAPRHRHDLPGLTAPREASFNQPDAPTAPAWLRNRPPLTAGQVAGIDRDYRLRAQSVEAVDQLLGGLRAALRETGQAGNTYVVFSSDNGYHMGQHRLMPGKETAFATDLTVPLVAVGPGIAPGRTIARLAQNVDLAPTFADLGHAGALPRADGHTLQPLLAGQDPPDWRAMGLVEHHGPNTRPDDPDRAVGPGTADPPSYLALTTGPETYVEYATGEREYHDIRADPDQRTNTAATLPPLRLAALHTALTALATCQGTACWQAGARAP